MNLGSTDPDRNSQHLRTGYAQSKGCIKAGPRLLNETEVEPRRVSDRLNVGWVVKVGLRRRDSWMLSDGQTRDRLRERRPEIRIFFASVPSPPSGIHTELHEVGEPSDLLGTGCFTARQVTEPIQIDGLLPFDFK
jgi:hypothetical protein